MKKSKISRLSSHSRYLRESALKNDSAVPEGAIPASANDAVHPELPGGHCIHSIKPFQCEIRLTSLYACSMHGPRASSIEQYLIVGNLKLVKFHRRWVVRF